MLEPSQLARDIEVAVRKAIDDGLVGQDLRKIIVGPTDDRHLVNIWAAGEWNGYDTEPPKAPVASVDNRPWLEAIDALEARATRSAGSRAKVLFDRVESSIRPPRLAHPDARVDAAIVAQEATLRATIQEALRMVASRGAIDGLTSPIVGLFEHNVGERSAMQLVAFYHPHGAGLLLPLFEKIPPRKLLYPWASLHAGGLTLFYTGEDDVADAAVQELAFSEMLFTTIDEGKVRIRLKNSPVTCEYEHGHTHGLSMSDREVDALLATHIRKRPELLLDLNAFPPPAQAQAVKRYVALYREGGLQFETRDLVRAIVRDHGVDAPALLLEELPTTHAGRTQGYGVWAEALAEAGDYAKALRAAHQIDPSWHYYYWEAELESLAELGRFAELDERCTALADSQGRGHSGPSSVQTAPYRALALIKQGRTAEAVSLLAEAPSGRGEHERLWVLAAATADDKPRAAATLLRSALREGSSFVRRAARDFAAHPALLAIIAERTSIEHARAASLAAVGKRTRRVVAKTLPRPAPTSGSWLVRGKTAKASAKPKPRAGSKALERALPVDDRVESWLHGKGFALALTSSGVIVVDTKRPARPVVLTALAISEQTHTAALLDGLLLVVAAVDHLAWFDLAKPHAPKLIACMALALAPDVDENLYIRSLAHCGEALVAQGAGLLVFRRAKGRPPALLGRLDITPGPCAADRGRLVIADTRSDTLWDVALPVTGGARVRDVAKVFRASGAKVDLDEARAIVVRGKKVHLAMQRGALACERVVPKLRKDDLDQRARKLVAPLTGLAARTIAAHHATTPDFRVGSVTLAWHGGPELTLTLDAPRGFVGLESGPVLAEPPSVTLAFEGVVPTEALHGLLSWGPGVDDGAGAREGDPDESRARQRRRLEVWHATLRDVARKLARRPELDAGASGRVYLLVQSAGLELVATVRKPVAWVPYRPMPVAAASVPIEQLIEDHQQTNALLRRARDDASVRADIFRLSAQGRWMAIKIAIALGAIDLEGAIACLASAAVQPDVGGFVAKRIIDFLTPHRTRRDVAAALERALTEGSEDARLFAAAALRRDDVLVPMVVRMLAMVRADGHCGGRDREECLEACVEALGDGLKTIEPTLLDIVMHAPPSDGDLLAIVATGLYRSGYPSLPKAVRDLAKSAKGDEQYHGRATGVAELDDESIFSPAKIASAERAWTSDALVARVSALAGEGDGAQSIWPPDLSPEPYAASWRYFLTLAWPKLEARRLVDWLVSTLVHHAGPGAAWENDKKLLLACYDELARRKDSVRAAMLAKAVVESPAGAFDGASDTSDARLRRLMGGLHGQASVVRGFELARAGKLDEARAVCDAVLASTPSDGQALFLDARLAWLAGTPESGIARARENLSRATDPAGRGRLHNLVGCALDELRRWPEAIEAFKQASSVHEDAEYLANVAECYQKLGDADNARSYAQLAKRGGSSAAIIATILGGP